MSVRRSDSIATLEQAKARVERKAKFIKALAQFLAGNPAAKSIALQIEASRPAGPLPSWAHEWAEVRNWGPNLGYDTVEEAERKLKEFLA